MEKEEPVLVPVKQVLSLIRDHYEDNDESFRKNSEWLCNYLYEIGKDQLAEYIFVLMNPSAGWVPQEFDPEKYKESLKEPIWVKPQKYQ